MEVLYQRFHCTTFVDFSYCSYLEGKSATVVYHVSEGEPKRTVLYERWEESALQCSSLSQVFLHLAALDKSIKWDRSALTVRCRICRRKGDPEKMLLCDKCDRGHHMYCLKPPMTVST